MSIIEEAKEYQQNFTGINHRADRVIRKLVTEYEKANKELGQYKQVVEAAGNMIDMYDVSTGVEIARARIFLEEALNQLSEVK